MLPCKKPKTNLCYVMLPCKKPKTNLCYVMCLVKNQKQIYVMLCAL